MPLPNDLVRVRIDGVEKNLGRAYAKATDGVEILDEPVRNRDGSLRGETRAGGRPVKPKTTVAKKAAAKKAASKKAAAKKAAAKRAVAPATPEAVTTSADTPATPEAVTTSADDTKEQDL